MWLDNSQNLVAADGLTRVIDIEYPGLERRTRTVLMDDIGEIERQAGS
jgi:hypothetical protein